MLHDAGAPLLITTSALGARLPATGARSSSLMRGGGDCGAAQPRAAHAACAHNLATSSIPPAPPEYPKAWRSRIRTSCDVRRHEDCFRFDARGGNVWTLFHSFAFDFSVLGIWGALLQWRPIGDRSLFGQPASPDEFLTLLAREGVSILNQTPSAFYQLVQAQREQPELGERLALRHVIFGR